MNPSQDLCNGARSDDKPMMDEALGEVRGDAKGCLKALRAAARTRLDSGLAIPTNHHAPSLLIS